MFRKSGTSIKGVGMHACVDSGLPRLSRNNHWKVRMSINSKIRFASIRNAFPLLFGVALLILTDQSVVGQQPLKHIPPVDAKPLPEMNRLASLDGIKTGHGFVPRAVRQPAVLHSDTQVVQASYENRSAPQPLSEMRAAPIAADLPWSYELQNLSYQQFEDKLTEIWGRRMLGKPLDAEKKTLRIFFPSGKSSPEQTMTFDRVSRIATFEGSPSRKSSWHQLMQKIDQTESAEQAVKIIDVGTTEPEMIRQVVYAVQQAPQDDPPQERRQIDFGAANLTPEQQRQILSQLDIPKFPFGRKPTIILSDDLGTIAIEGHPDDVDTLYNFISELIQLAPTLDRRSLETVMLNNSSPTELATTLTEIYEAQYLGQYGPVEIRPIPSSRSILILGGPAGVQQAARLARAFDGDSKSDDEPLAPDEKGFVTYRLKYLSPPEAKRAVDEFFGVATGFGGGGGAATDEPPPVRTTIEERAGTITIVGSPILRKRAIAFLEEIDRPGVNKNSRIIRIYNVRNQVASTLQVTLSDILGGGLQQNQGFSGNNQNQNLFNNNLNNNNFNQSTRPQTGITTLVIEGRDGFIGDGGRAFDVRITADDSSNSLAIVAHEETWPLINELLSQLDRIPNLTSEVKVFPIYNGDATEILDTLNQIFTGSGTGQTQQQNTQQGSLQLPLQSPASDGASLLNLRFAINERLNVIIASGSISDLEFVEALINRLDERNTRSRQTRIYRLSNASAADISTTINAWLDELETVNDNNPQLGGGNVQSLVPASTTRCDRSGRSGQQ